MAVAGQLQGSCRAVAGQFRIHLVARGRLREVDEDVRDATWPQMRTYDRVRVATHHTQVGDALQHHRTRGEQLGTISSDQAQPRPQARPSWPITAITANINQGGSGLISTPAPPPPHSNGSSGLISPPAPKSKRSVCPPAGPCARRSSRLDHDAVRWLPNSLSPHQQVPARPPIPLCPRPLRA